MKRFVSLLLILVLALIVVGCGGNNAPEPQKTPEKITYKDGTYTAEQDDFGDNGYKEKVKIVVSNGVIAYVDWDAIHKDGGPTKKEASKNGQYKMVEKGGAKYEWHVQASAMETYLLGAQDPKTIKLDKDGKTDTVAGVSIHVDSFVELCEKALKDARVE